MAKKPSLITIRKQFDARMTASEELFGAVRTFADGTWHSINGWEALYPGQARQVVALSFMHLIISWEDLVEAAFVRYLVGSSSPSGWKPTLRIGTASSLDHAYQLVSGSASFRRGADYMTWSNWKDVIERAKLFFARGEPFSLLTQLERDRLTDAVKLRNRVAHASSKSKTDFIELAKRHLGVGAGGKLPQGFGVGQLLIDTSAKCFGNTVRNDTYFGLYHGMLNAAANKLCPK
ncbi:MAG: hypothetical protein JNL58_30220 [Planctomyces sp.]|nr:hypothetical protein [Planctomyces sp.]